jgi:hypothetical protein
VANKNAKILSQKARREKDNPKVFLDRLECPVESCGKAIKRLDKHLKVVHKLKSGTQEYLKYSILSNK